MKLRHTVITVHAPYVNGTQLQARSISLISQWLNISSHRFASTEPHSDWVSLKVVVDSLRIVWFLLFHLIDSSAREL